MSSKLSSLFEHRGGLHLKDTILWFDAPEPKQLCFISHAQIPNAFCHQKILTTENTAKLLSAIASAYGQKKHVHMPKALVTPFGRNFALGELSLKLIPAGHILGSASLLIEYRNQIILYAGHINLRRSSIVEPIQTRNCNLLILPCPFGATRSFSMLPSQKAEDTLMDFVKSSLANKQIPVLLSRSIGEPQLAINLLSSENITFHVHREIYAACKVYNKHSPTPLDITNVRRFSGQCDPQKQEVVIWPIRLRNSISLKKFSNLKTALVSDLALCDKDYAQKHNDVPLPLGTNADYASLLEYVRACSPKEVLLTGGNSSDLAEDLKAMGITVNQIGPQEQLTLF